MEPAEAATTTFRLEVLGPPTLRDDTGQTPVGLGTGKPLGGEPCLRGFG